MNAKTLLGFVFSILLLWKFAPASEIKRPPLALARPGTAVLSHDFVPLFDADKPLASLAHDGVYTVVEVYINTCSTCKQIEARLPDFTARRNDVVVRRVHFPEEGISWPFDQAPTMEARMDAYKICGTPHIEIYDPQRRLVSADDCGNKRGLHFLREWMNLEQART